MRRCWPTSARRWPGQSVGGTRFSPSSRTGGWKVAPKGQEEFRQANVLDSLGSNRADSNNASRGTGFLGELRTGALTLRLNPPRHRRRRGPGGRRCPGPRSSRSARWRGPRSAGRGSGAWSGRPVAWTRRSRSWGAEGSWELGGAGGSWGELGGAGELWSWWGGRRFRGFEGGRGWGAGGRGEECLRKKGRSS